MAPGNSVRNKSRKLTAELTSSSRQKLTRGKYKNKLIYKQTLWARGGVAARRSGQRRTASPGRLLIHLIKKNHPLRVVQLETINLECRLILTPTWDDQKIHTDTIRPDNSSTYGRLDFPQNEDVAAREQQRGGCTLLRRVGGTLVSNETSYLWKWRSPGGLSVSGCWLAAEDNATWLETRQMLIDAQKPLSQTNPPGVMQHQLWGNRAITN